MASRCRFFDLKTKQLSILIILICSICSACDKSNNPKSNIEPEFEELWRRYNESSDGGWKNNQNGRFSWDDAYAMDGLIYAFKTNQNTSYLDKFIQLADVIVKNQDKIVGLKDKFRNNLSLPGWGSTRYTDDGSNHIFNVTDAMILSSFVSYYNTVYSNNLPQKYKIKAQQYLQIALQEFEEVQDKDFVDLNNGMGYFQDPYFTAKSLRTPINQFSRIGTLCLELFKATKNPKFYNYASKLAKYLRSNFIEQGDYFYWNYYPKSLNGSQTDIPDDLAHAVLVVEFIVKSYENDIVFNKDEINKLVNLFLKKIYVNGSFSVSIDGSDGFWKPEEVYVNYFMLLAKYDPRVYHAIAEWYKVQNFKFDRTSFLNHFGERLILMDGLIKYFKPK